jgi:hypothetical protein
VWSLLVANASCTGRQHARWMAALAVLHLGAKVVTRVALQQQLRVLRTIITGIVFERRMGMP